MPRAMPLPCPIPGEHRVFLHLSCLDLVNDGLGPSCNHTMAGVTKHETLFIVSVMEPRVTVD
jgi:hypothetical protein